MSYILLLTIHADPAMPPGYDEWGGTHTYMRELLDCFESLHINCILVTRKAMEELPDIEQYNPYCTIYRLKNGNPAPIDKTILHTYHDYNLSAIQQIIQNIGELPQVIHSVYWNSGRLGVELSKKYNIPLVHSVISNSYGRQARGAYEPLPQRAGYEQIIYDYAQWILCVSEDEKNDLIKYYGISPQKIIVAGQYIHPSFILPSRDINGFPRLNSKISTEAQISAALRYNNAFENTSNDSFWVYKAFTYFGRIDESKGVDHILAAWCSLYLKYKDSCPPLWLIGGSVREINIMRKKCQAIENYIHQAEQEGKIIWWGCIDAIGASTLLLKTLVLVTNSLYEPGGRVITEAMSEGVPVIAAPNGFALDLVHDWENGFLVNHGDESSLAMRMEHFIRQPFLSNSLGETARQTAHHVISEWDFIDKHLMAYGLKTMVKKSKATSSTTINHFTKREINLFPYRNLPLSNSLLRDFLEKTTGEKVISDPVYNTTSGTSDVYLVQSVKGNYIIKHPYTRLALSPLILPFQKTNYVRNAWDFYKYEVAAYETSSSDILVGKDDIHQLLLLRKLDSFTPGIEDYPNIVTFLGNQQIELSDNSNYQYNKILSNNKMETIEDLDFLLETLSVQFPDYYFESNGAFLPYIGWKMAQYILDYNSTLFNSEQKSFLYMLCDSFSQLVESHFNLNWYEITSDISLQHIMLDNGKITFIDREKRTIGQVEYMIADLLLDIIICEINVSSNTWITLLKHHIPQNCNKKQIIESLAYKLFFNTILESVMQNEVNPSYLEALNTLLHMENTL